MKWKIRKRGIESDHQLNKFKDNNKTNLRADLVLLVLMKAKKL